MHREELFSDIDRWLDEHYPQLEQALMESLSIASVRAEEAPGAPFGVEVARALQHALQLAQSWGFAVCDVDGYCGIADMFGAETADMSECIGVLGHLDVVPARAEDWTYPPFAPRCIDGRIYGRGTTDDKGPLFAALFAARALHECGLDFGKGLRFIMGCNEESGMACVRYYLQHHHGSNRDVKPNCRKRNFTISSARCMGSSERRLPPSVRALRRCCQCCSGAGCGHAEPGRTAFAADSRHYGGKAGR